MKTWTIILAAATLLLASCVEDDAPPKMDNTLTGSISYNYYHVGTNVYVNGAAVMQTDHGGAGFTKLDETHAMFGYRMPSANASYDSYNVIIKNVKVYGRPYDVSFDYYSELREDEFFIDNVEQAYKTIKMEGWLYNGFAEMLYTPHFATRDWSPPGYEGDLKITVLSEDGTEYLFEITRIS